MKLSPRGFTLIEVLVAASLFSILLLAVPSLLGSTIRANRHARSVSAATTLAQDKLEDLRQQAYAAIASGKDANQLTEMEVGGTQRAAYTRTWSVSNGPAAGTKTIVVQVKWADAGSQRVELQTIVAE